MVNPAWLGDKCAESAGQPDGVDRVLVSRLAAYHFRADLSTVNANMIHYLRPCVNGQLWDFLIFQKVRRTLDFIGLNRLFAFVVITTFKKKLMARFCFWCRPRFSCYDVDRLSSGRWSVEYDVSDSRSPPWIVQLSSRPFVSRFEIHFFKLSQVINILTYRLILPHFPPLFCLYCGNFA